MARGVRQLPEIRYLNRVCLGATPRAGPVTRPAVAAATIDAPSWPAALGERRQDSGQVPLAAPAPRPVRPRPHLLLPRLRLSRSPPLRAGAAGHPEAGTRRSGTEGATRPSPAMDRKVAREFRHKVRATGGPSGGPAESGGRVGGRWIPSAPPLPCQPVLGLWVGWDPEGPLVASRNPQ